MKQILSRLTAPVIVAVAGATLAVLAAFGVELTGQEGTALLGLVTLLAGVLVGEKAQQLRAKSASGAMTARIEAAGRRFKGGRLPGVIPDGLKTFLEYATKLATAPLTWPAPAGSYPMDNNDVEGDCTIAGGAHLLQAWNRLFGQKITIPTRTTIRKIYRKLTSGEDTGLVEADVLKHWKTSGLFTAADKIFGYAPIKITDRNAIKLAIARYGGAYLGIVVGQPQEEQFDNGQPWKWVPRQEREGHCVVALGYTKDGLLCATWGGIALLPWAFLTASLEEAWVILPQALVKAGKDTLGLDLEQLEQDLAHV